MKKGFAVLCLGILLLLSGADMTASAAPQAADREAGKEFRLALSLYDRGMYVQRAG